MQPASPWWRPHVHADRRPLLHARARAAQAARQVFAESGFLEVDTAALQLSPGNEAHIGAFATAWVAPDGTATPVYLHSSPEFACKKLLAAGEHRIFAFAHVFRNRERGRLHHPEFTMLEWYRAGVGYMDLAADCATLLARTAEAVGAERLVFGEASCDPLAAFEVLPVTHAFARHAGIDLEAALDDRAAMAKGAARAGVRVTADDTWSDIFSKVLCQCVEPHLGLGRPTLLADYPACEAALARTKPDDPRFAERFELYACGVELANAFGELTDPVEQRARFEAAMATRDRLYGERYPIDTEFLEALAIMPEASGIALGFDRLVMLLTGAPHIEQVIWTPLADLGGAR
jgi:lysyl-tRNA synthetase class 2